MRCAPLLPFKGVTGLRLRMTFSPARHTCVLPVHYNHLVQAFVYEHLDKLLAASVHDEGFVEGNRRLKLFTFSRLQGRSVVREGQITFAEDFSLVVASPEIAFLESLALNAMSAQEMRLGNNSVHLTALEVEQDPPYSNPVLLRALSPITVYSTLSRADGKRKTYYFSPFESEFSQLLIINLQRKWRAYGGSDVPLDGAYVKPVSVKARNQHVALYKGTVIKAWSGIYEASLPEPLFRMALDAGLGSKNSQGFGCMAVCRRAMEEVFTS